MTFTFGRKCKLCHRDIDPRRYKLAVFCSSHCRELFNEAKKRNLQQAPDQPTTDGVKTAGKRL